MIPISLVLVPLLLLSAFSTDHSAQGQLIVHESRSTIPPGYIRLGSAPLDAVISLRIGLLSKNASGLETMLYAVSTPSNPLYGQHLSFQQVKVFLAPSNDTAVSVNSWLSSHNITSITSSPVGDWLSLSVSVSQANSLLNTTFDSFLHIDSGKQSIRTLSYSLPSYLQAHIEVIHPTIVFSPLKSARSVMALSKPTSNQRSTHRINLNASCPADPPVDPACLQELYGIPATPASSRNITIGIPGYINYWAQKADLQAFLERYRPDINPNTTYSFLSIDNGTDPQGADLAAGEPNLDVQYTIGLATGIPVTFTSVGGVNGFEDFVSAMVDVNNAVLALKNRPQVMTTSYGLNENITSYALEKKVCDGVMALGAVGTSWITAAGDGGVGGALPGNVCVEFVPEFPSTCPYATSMGGTTHVPEIAANFTGGGFSNYFSRPAYQNSVVSAYLSSLGSTYSGLYNSSGRAFPDIATQAYVDIVNGTEFTDIWGTSCASPIFASIVALINDRLVAAGKPLLGFLNPFIYANPSAFNDITFGNNPGCDTDGFSATVGWDPVTGLGTPKFDALLAAAGL